MVDGVGGAAMINLALVITISGKRLFDLVMPC